uniref:Uncharacterized protein n=1 Tax=Opuntia streptacantha TaxID=393608 RepID=A0A7C9AKA1_OPUST
MINPLFNIIRGHHMVARFAPRFSEVNFSSALGTWLRIPTYRIPIRLHYEMVTLCTHRMPTPSYDSALVAVDGSRSGDLFFDNIEADDGRRQRFRRLGEVSGAEKHLPRHQMGKERRRWRKERVAREKRPDVGPERTGGDTLVGRRWKRQKVVKVRRHPPLHALQGPRVHHHGRQTNQGLELGLGYQISGKTKTGFADLGLYV